MYSWPLFEPTSDRPTPSSPHRSPRSARRSALLSAGLAAVVLTAARSEAAEGPSKVAFSGGYPVTSRAHLYPLEKVRVGDEGIGYTVFQGNEVKPFGFRVLGILHGMLGPHRDVILARLTGPDIEYTGVIAGMSGSPVFIDGQLVGAVSYRFGAFSKEPIAGITPIQSMLEIYEPGDVAPAPRFAGSPRPIETAAFRSRAEVGLLPLPPVASRSSHDVYDPRPIETPIALAGFSPYARSALTEALEQAGMVAAPGGVASGAPAQSGTQPNQPSEAGGVKAAPIAPGAPIAAVLMRGDLFAAGTGTVTFLDGTRVLAFGHPFFGYGHVAFPMATAAILNTLATPAGSYKQAATSINVGVISHDRLTAIAGELGQAAPMVPIRIRLVPESAGKAAQAITTNVEVVEHEFWLPTMLQSAMGSASSGRLGFESGGTVDFRARIQVDELTMEYSDTYSTAIPMPVGALAARDVAGTAAQILQSGVAAAKIRSIDIEMTVDPEPHFAELERLSLSKRRVTPGETVRVRAFVRPYRADESKVVELDIEVPSDAEGDLVLHVGGSIELDQRDEKTYGRRRPENLQDLLSLLIDRRKGRGLYARFYLPRPGLRSDIELWPSLPISARMTLADSGDVRRAPTREAFGPSARAELSEVILGELSTTLHVVPR